MGCIEHATNVHSDMIILTVLESKGQMDMKMYPGPDDFSLQRNIFLIRSGHGISIMVPSVCSAEITPIKMCMTSVYNVTAQLSRRSCTMLKCEVMHHVEM